MPSVAEALSRQNIKKLVDAGYITVEQAEQMLKDAHKAKTAAEHDLEHMTRQGFKRLMEAPPAPIRSSRNRKHIKEGWK